MNKSNKFSAEIRERTVRMVREHRDEYRSHRAAIESLAPKIGCTSQTLLGWLKREPVDSGERVGRGAFGEFCGGQKRKRAERPVLT